MERRLCRVLCTGGRELMTPSAGDGKQLTASNGRRVRREPLGTVARLPASAAGPFPSTPWPGPGRVVGAESRRPQTLPPPRITSPPPPHTHTRTLLHGSRRWQGQETPWGARAMPGLKPRVGAVFLLLAVHPRGWRTKPGLGARVTCPRFSVSLPQSQRALPAGLGLCCQGLLGARGSVAAR